MENQHNQTSEGTTPTHNPEGNWIADRQAAHLAAFQEVRRMTDRELAALLVNAAEDFADRAGDLTAHDDAMPDLFREAALLRAAEILRKGGSR